MVTDESRSTNVKPAKNKKPHEKNESMEWLGKKKCKERKIGL